MKWYYIEEHGPQHPIVYMEWTFWLEENVGKYGEEWKWDDSGGYHFICFAKEEDITLFKLRFKL